MTQIARPDVDIEEDVQDIIAHYPPLQADRHQIQVDVHDGVVTLRGHVRTLNTRSYFVDRVAQVRGIYAVDSDRLFSAETIRLESGRRIPLGVLANVSYGTVILTGTLPEGKSAEEIVRNLTSVPGIERVVAKF